MHLSSKALSVNPSTTLTIDAKFKLMKSQGISVISFGAGEPDFDTPYDIKIKAIRAIEQGYTKYTHSAGMLALREAICNKLKRDNNLEYCPDEIIVSNGAKHSLYNVFTAICDVGDEVIIAAPYWVSYPEIVKMAGGKPIIVNTTKENDFKITPTQFLAAITPKTRAIIINTPNNPTGMIYPRQQLAPLAQIALENNIYIISDEIYEKLIYEDEHISIASLDPKLKNITVVVNGVSKAYAMTGWRIGYTAANKTLTTAMNSIQSHMTSNANSIAQYATLAALEGDQHMVETMRTEYNIRRDFMVDKINSIHGVSCIKPKGAFYVMMNIENLLNKEFYGKKINNCCQLCDSILEIAKVSLVPLTDFGTEKYARLSYATSLENITEGLTRIEKYIKFQHAL